MPDSWETMYRVDCGWRLSQGSGKAAKFRSSATCDDSQHTMDRVPAGRRSIARLGESAPHRE
jgi:hypothetical protein